MTHVNPATDNNSTRTKTDVLTKGERLHRSLGEIMQPRPRRGLHAQEQPWHTT